MSGFRFNLPLTARWRIATFSLLAVILLIALDSSFSLNLPAAGQGMTPTATTTPVGTVTPSPTPTSTPSWPTAPAGLGTTASEDVGLFSEVDGGPPPSTDVETIASRLVGIDFGQLTQVTKPPVGPKDPATGEPPPPQTLVLNLFDNVVFTGIVEHVERTSSGHALWGRLEGVELGTMTLVVNGSVVVGTVRTLGAVYSIRTVGDGKYVIRQIDESSLPPPGEPLEPTLTPRDNGDDADNFLPDDGSEIDVMVVYTSLARRQQGGRAAIETLIDLLVAEANQAYANSGVIHRIRLVLREEVDYVEDGDSGIDLHRLANYPDGYMDHIHMLRDRYTADLVHILVGSGDVAGTAHRGGGFGLSFSLVGMTFAHELGHNMGLRHDRYTSGVPRTGFRYGYVNQRAFEPGAPVSARWRTIMSYNRQCARVGGFHCARIPYFSNPAMTYNGDPMGVPVNHPSTDVDGPADAVRGLNERRETTANFRRSSSSPTPRVGLTLSPYWLAENGGTSRLTATLHRTSTEDTTVTVSVSQSHAVTLVGSGTLTIKAGETVSTGHVTITGVDNDDSTGDVIVTVSATVTNTSSLGVIEPEPVELAIADDETTPVVTLVLSPEEIVEHEGLTFVTALLDNRSSADTTITVSTTPADPVVEIFSGTLTIPAGQTTSRGYGVFIYAIDDDNLAEAEKTVTVFGAATNPHGVTGPESVTLTVIDDEAPYFTDDSISFSFTSGVPASRDLPEAMYGNGTLTYSITPTPSNGVTFDTIPRARILVSEEAVASDEASYALTATDADGDIGTMTVNITIAEGVCPGSNAVLNSEGPGILADCEALLASMDLLRGDQSLNWHYSLPIDAWQGVSIANNRVVGIDLWGSSLTGTIPSEFGSLTELQLLRLNDNNLTGEIPAELGGLANLQVLRLGSNELTGEIPPELERLTNLQSLSLNSNELTGQIPPSLSTLQELHHLILGYNRLVGSIPSELGRLANLRELVLAGNELNGLIPGALGDLESLKYLDLGSNQLTGPIPAEFSDLANLEIMYLGSNELSGPIPTGLVALAKLELLDLANNRLTGKIPTELGDFANLERLDLSSNQLSGPIPTELSNLGKLLDLFLPDNLLTGRIPTELSFLANLQRLSLGRNQLNGPIPGELGELSNLYYLELARNHLTGPIPTELGDLANLEVLDLRTNQLTGQIPVPLGILTNLKSVFLSSNELTGCVPASLREVTYNDLRRLGLPFCDVLLEALAVSPGSLIPAFDPLLTDYVALATTSLVTVTPVTEIGATVHFLDQNQNEIPDADGSTDGHQIDLATGVTTISVVVTSQDGLAHHTYTIRVAEAPGASTINAVTPGKGYLAVIWTMPDDTGGLDIKSYDIRYIETAADETVESNWTVVEDVWNATSGGDLQYVITGLTGETPYDTQVRAENAKGTGPWSATMTGTPAAPSICVAGGAVKDATNTGLISDCEALLAAEDVLAVNASLDWSEATPIVQWDGVSLGGTPRRVTRLDLAGKGLDGTIPSVLGRLSMLTHLNLRSNDRLTGEIPSELGYLSNLRVLNLHSNSHSGSIPDLSGMTSLEELYLANNDLTGPVPTWLNGMTNMRELWLWGNSLSGTVPDLSGMTGLQKLKLANNMLTGGVPDGSMLPPNVTWLIIDRNPLGGTIPDLSGLKSLRLLWLHTNMLEGQIPSGDMLPPNVDDLNLRDNMLTGEIPDLSGLDTMTRLRLHNNKLSGEIPATLGDLDNLRSLWLHGNMLDGSIPASLGGLTNLERLWLSGNELTGEIPEELGDLTRLTQWRLADNRITGCVPASLKDIEDSDLDKLGLPICEGGDRPSVTETFTAISSGTNHTCALRADGTPVCWGAKLGDEGEVIGQTGFGQSEPPEGEHFVSISSGGNHTCALRADGTPVCWGAGFEEQDSSVSGPSP